jgi:chromosome segregation protein
VKRDQNGTECPDSEIVAACAYEETISVVAGSIDTKESQGKIVSIMEGGKEAFDRRKTIYEIWDAAEA